MSLKYEPIILVVLIISNGSEGNKEEDRTSWTAARLKLSLDHPVGVK